MEPFAFIYRCIESILIDECTGDGVQDISIFKSQCENMTFSDQIRYNRMFQKAVRKGGESEINYI